MFTGCATFLRARFGAFPCLGLLVCLALVPVLAGCGARRATEPVAPEPVMAGDEALPLDDTLYRLRAEQYAFSADYTRLPEEGSSRYFRIAREPAVLTLADDVTAFDAPVVQDLTPGGDRSEGTAPGAVAAGLAFARADGTVRIFGDPSRGVVHLPEGTTAKTLAYDPLGRTLAAVLADGSLLWWDLGWSGNAKGVDLPGQPLLVAVGGGSLGVVLADGTVLAGSGSRLSAIGSVGGTPLDAAFAPGGGVLLVATDGGAVASFNVRDGQKMDGQKLEGGTITAAEINGRTVLFTTASGRVRALDAATGRELGAPRTPARFRLSYGRLTYRTWRSILSRSELSGNPSFRVWHSSALNIFQVEDLDGLARCHAATNGKTVPCPPNSDWDLNGWSNVQADENGRFCRAGMCYRLADPVFHLEHEQLWCRFIPESGFYLWWRQTDRPGAANPMDGRLPVRESIRESDAPVWLPLLPPANMP